jgi:hypothetical protein
MVFRMSLPASKSNANNKDPLERIVKKMDHHV